MYVYKHFVIKVHDIFKKFEIANLKSAGSYIVLLLVGFAFVRVFFPRT